MESKHVLISVVAGLLSAMLSLAFVSGNAISVFFLVYLVPLPMLLVGLALGSRATLVAAGAGMALSFGLGAAGAAMFAILHGLPSWVIVMMAQIKTDPTVAKRGTDVEEELPGRKAPETNIPGLPERPRSYDVGAVKSEPSPDKGWFPAGSIVVWIAILACIYMVAASVFLGGDLRGAVVEYISRLFEIIATDQDANVRLAATDMLADFFPGMLGAFWVLMLGVNTIFAQGLLAKGKFNLRPSPRIKELTLPDWPSWALVGIAVLALFGPGEVGYLGRNMFVVLATPYFFLGLAVVHVLASGLRFPGFLLGAIYAMTLATGWFALVVGGIGILEQWVGLRRRIVKPQ